MGTVYYAGGYERVIELVQNFTESKQVPANLTYLWNTTAGDAIPPMNRADFYAKLILQDRSDLNATTVQLEFVKQILQYILAYFDIFGVSLGQIPPQPNNMDMVRGSFLEFLTRNNILGTRHYFAGSLTLQGYGQLDEIPAIYGLMWNTPQQVLATILAVGQEERSMYSIVFFISLICIITLLVRPHLPHIVEIKFLRELTIFSISPYRNDYP